MPGISAIDGIGKLYARKLSEFGVKTVEDLLHSCATPTGRRKLSTETGINPAKLLSWTNKADLFRIRGVSSQYSELLEAAGVDTVKELQHRNPENLLERMREVNSMQKLVRQVPALSQVRSFVSQAKNLEPVVRH
jgi:predicted flap endonuclease-1-like 5' DNA nuclease